MHGEDKLYAENPPGKADNKGGASETARPMGDTLAGAEKLFLGPKLRDFVEFGLTQPVKFENTKVTREEKVLPNDELGREVRQIAVGHDDGQKDVVTISGSPGDNDYGNRETGVVTTHPDGTITGYRETNTNAVIVHADGTITDGQPVELVRTYHADGTFTEEVAVTRGDTRNVFDPRTWDDGSVTLEEGELTWEQPNSQETSLRFAPANHSHAVQIELLRDLYGNVHGGVSKVPQLGLGLTGRPQIVRNYGHEFTSMR